VAADPPDGETGAGVAVRRPLWNWIIVLVAVAIGAVVIYLALTNSPIGSQEEFEDLLDELGWWAPVFYIMSMAVLQPLGIPGLVFMVPAALVWPAGEAIGYSWIGNMLASSIAFVFARRFGQGRLRPRIPERILRYEQRVIDREYISITLLRVFTGQLVAADWFLGLSRVRVLPFLVGTGLGIIPGILLAVYAGSGFVELFVARPLLTGGLVVGAIVGWRILKRRTAGRSITPADE
jgi:uncharacterized membrane protein YdjX (TVP38/TMEM64 family)